jgi:hypothetical protein
MRGDFNRGTLAQSGAGVNVRAGVILDRGAAAATPSDLIFILFQAEPRR